MPKLKSYKEAMAALKEVSYFLEYKGHGHIYLFLIF